MSLLICHSSFSKDAISNCRDYYYGVCLGEVSIHEFDAYLTSNKNSKDLTVKGYQTVIWFLWAEYYVNPIKKWQCFIKGKDELDELIRINAHNAELRFLRLTIQQNVPKFLGYNDNINDDKALIYSKLNEGLDSDLRQRIISYLCDNGMAKIK